MKIYSIYEYGGERENRYERVLGSFVSEEKALEFKSELEEDCFYDEFYKYDISEIEINDANDYIITRKG